MCTQFKNGIAGSLFVSAAFALLASSPANATLVLTPGGNPSAPFDQVDIPSCDSGAGNPLVSCLKSNNGIGVIFQGTESLEFQGTSVQAATGSSQINANQWGFDDVTISLGSGYTFSQIVLKLDLHVDDNITFSSNLDPNLVVAVTANGNSDLTISSSLGNLAWLRIQSDDHFIDVKHGKDIIAQVADGDIMDLKNISFDGVTPPCTANCGGPPPSVPEPATLALFASGLLAAGGLSRRKRKTS